MTTSNCPLRFLARAVGLWIFLTTVVGAAPLRLEHIGTKWDEYGHFVWVFRFTNPSDTPISYVGWMSDSGPLPVVEVLRSGVWRDVYLGCLGPERNAQRLAPHRSILVSLAPQKAGATWRVGVPVMQPPSFTRWEVGVWTDPLSTDAATPAAAKSRSAARMVETRVSRNPDPNAPYTFTLTNISSQPLYYGGFQGTKLPAFHLQQDRFLGRWQGGESAMFYGTGDGFRKLSPGASLTFTIPSLNLWKTWRLGVRLYRTPRPVVPADAYPPV